LVMDKVIYFNVILLHNMIVNNTKQKIKIGYLRTYKKRTMKWSTPSVGPTI